MKGWRTLFWQDPASSQNLLKSEVLSIVLVMLIISERALSVFFFPIWTKKEKLSMILLYLLTLWFMLGPFEWVTILRS